MMMPRNFARSPMSILSAMEPMSSSSSGRPPGRAAVQFPREPGQQPGALHVQDATGVLLGDGAAGVRVADAGGRQADLEDARVDGHLLVVHEEPAAAHV